MDLKVPISKSKLSLLLVPHHTHCHTLLTSLNFLSILHRIQKEDEICGGNGEKGV